MLAGLGHGVSESGPFGAVLRVLMYVSLLVQLGCLVFWLRIALLLFLVK